MSDDFDADFDDPGNGDDANQDDWFDNEPDDDVPDFAYPGIGEVDEEGWIRSPAGGVMGRDLYGYSGDTDGNILGRTADVAPDRDEDDSAPDEDPAAPEPDDAEVDEDEADESDTDPGSYADPYAYDAPAASSTATSRTSPATPRRPTPTAAPAPRPRRQIPRVSITSVILILASLGLWYVVSISLSHTFLKSHPTRDTEFIYITNAFLFTLVAFATITLLKPSVACFFRAIAILSLVIGTGSLVFFAVSVYPR